MFVQVEITGLDDKRQLTVVLGETLSGDVLPPQVIYQGKSDLCHAKANFPQGWHITHSENHWSNTHTMIEYADHILLPYVEETRENLDLPLRQRALVIMDVFKAHQSPAFLERLRSNGVDVVFVPPGCTGELQPLDVAGNGAFKEALSAR